MKIVSLIAKIVTALVTIAGAVYVCATYGDQIVAWAKKLLGSMPKCCCGETCACEECTCEAVEEAEETPVEAEEAATEEVVAEEAPVEESPAEENAVVAEETDFVG